MFLRRLCKGSTVCVRRRFRSALPARVPWCLPKHASPLSKRLFASDSVSGLEVKDGAWHDAGEAPDLLDVGEASEDDFLQDSWILKDDFWKNDTKVADTREAKTREADTGKTRPKRTSDPVVKYITRRGTPERAVLLEFSSKKPKRVYNSRGHRLVVNEEDLAMGILGQPAQAIILRERGKSKGNKRKHLQVEEAKAEEAAGPEMGQAEVAKARESPDWPAKVKIGEHHNQTAHGGAGALENIHELRPKGSKVLTGPDFLKLEETLESGFTNAQLISYRKKYRIPFHDPLPGWIKRRPRWVPDAQEGELNDASSLAGYVGRLSTPKERLATQIMREHWQLDREDINSRSGRLDVHLRRHEFNVLLIAEQKWLWKSTKHLVQSDGSLELSRDKDMLRIIAPKQTAELVLKAVIQLLDNIVVRTIDAEMVCPAHVEITDQRLTEVGELTETYIRASQKKIYVSWFGAKTKRQQIEDPGDVVFRILLQVYGGPQRDWKRSTKVAAEPLLIASEPGKPALNSYIPYTQSKDALTWTDRSRSWSRLVSTAGVGVPALRQSLKFLCDDLSLRYPLDVEDSSIISEPATATVDASKDWSTRLYTSTRAVFGHVLAEAPTPLDLSLRHNYNPELERVFVPVIPPLQHLNQLAPNLGSHTITNGLIVIRLMPNPVQTKLPKSFAAPKSSESAPGEEPNSLPPLELRLLSGREHVDHIVSLRALHETFRRDVLLPWNPVDVRMEQTRYYELAGCKISPDHPAAAVLDFCRDADLSVAKGKLRTPARLPGLRLPRWLLTHDPAPLIADGTSYELIELDYLFMGLEVQNSAVADYNGFALAYTSVEGGKRGGSRVELSVETKPTVPPSAPLPVNPQDPSGPLRPSTTLDHQASRAAVDAAFEAAFQDTLQDEYPQAQAAFDEGPVELGKSTAGGVDMSNARFRPEQASATTPASLEAPAVSPDVETGVSVETAALRTVSSDGTSPAAAAVDSSFDAAHPPEQANASHGVNPAALASAPSASPAPSSTTGASEPTVRPVLATNLSTRDREESSITANKNEACADHDADPAAGDGHTLPPESKLAISEPSARRAFMMAVSSIVYSGKAIRWTGDNK